MSLRTPFSYGTLSLPNNILFAPLAGCSDYPFRQMITPYRPGLLFCEMVKMEPLLRFHRNTYRYLHYDPPMHPIGAQLCGSDPRLAAASASILEDLGFDLIDFNCGCPVDKVTRDGSGSALLKNPEKIGEILSNMISAVSIPVTVKIRAGWNEQEICAPQVTKIAEEAGATAITIHGRTRAQGYRGRANWKHIRKCKEMARNILVIGNGDLFSAPDVQQMFDETGCDGVLIARGGLNKPWLIEEIHAHFSHTPLPSKSLSERIELLRLHLSYILRYRGEERGIVLFRSVAPRYLKEHPQTSALRYALSRVSSSTEIEHLINRLLQTLP